MKDPCKECLVSVCCAEICLEKVNYNILCLDALKYYKKNRRTEGHLSAMVQYNKQYSKALDLDRESFKSTSNILKRKTQRGR
jgi:hypothetical protein